MFIDSLMYQLVSGAIMLVPVWRIIDRTGANPWWSLFILVPFGGFGIMFYLALCNWPCGLGNYKEANHG